MSHPDHSRCWTWVSQATCNVCLDRTDGGDCMVPGRGDDCPLRTFLPDVVDVVRRLPGVSMDALVDAVESEVCPRCREMKAEGCCDRRNRGECSLYAFLPITVDAIEEGLRGLAMGEKE